MNIALRIRILPAREGTSEGRQRLRTWIETSQRALSHHRDADGSDAYLIDLDNVYIVLLTMRELGIASTEFCIDLERRSSRQRKPTVHALNRRVAAIATALMTVNDFHQLGRFSGAESDLRVILEALIQLMQTTQHELETL